MPTQVQFRRGTTAQNQNFTGSSGELSIDTDKQTVVVHDGLKIGGFPLAPNSAFDVANAAYGATNSAFGVINAAFTQSNTDNVRLSSAYVVVNSAFESVNTVGGYANTAGSLANQAGVIANGAFGLTNTTYAAVNSAFGVINAAYTQANTLTNSANAYTNTSTTAANNYAGFMANGAGAIGNAAFVRANAVYDATNSVFGVANGAFGNANATLVVASGAFDKANAANVLAYNTGIGANAYATVVGTAGNSYAAAVGVNANTYANATFLKLTGGSITGDLAITGNLTFTGNAITISSNTLSVGDSLIYLAANNYSGTDTLPIGFIANYGNNTGANVHAGLIRNPSNKEFYLFNGYDIEPGSNNQINFGSNNMTTAVLNADLVTSNLWLGGANAIPLITGSFGAANQAGVIANGAFGAANQAGVIANAAFGFANGVSTNTSAAFGFANGVSTNTTAAFGLSNTTYNAVNSAFGVINAAYSYANTSAQLAFKTIAVSGNNMVAGSNTATLTVGNSNGIIVLSNTTNGSIQLTMVPTGVTATTYGGATQIPTFTVDTYGKLTAASNVSLNAIANTDNVITAGSLQVANNLFIANKAFVSNTLTAIGSSSSLSFVLTNAAEAATISATAATGTINFDVGTQGVLYYTTNASANWTVNFRGSSGTTLNNMLVNNQSLTVAFLVTQGATPYYASAHQIDGTSVSPKWQGGTAPTSGNASGIDLYTYTIIKTGSATFTVLAALVQFK